MQRNNDDLTEGGQLLVHRGCLGMSHTWIQGTGVRVTFFKKVTHRICSTLLHKVLLHYFIIWPGDSQLSGNDKNLESESHTCSCHLRTEADCSFSV